MHLNVLLLLSVLLLALASCEKLGITGMIGRSLRLDLDATSTKKEVEDIISVKHLFLSKFLSFLTNIESLQGTSSFL